MYIYISYQLCKQTLHAITQGQLDSHYPYPRTVVQATVAEKVDSLRDAAADNGGCGRTEGPLKEPIPQRPRTAGPKFHKAFTKAFQ